MEHDAKWFFNFFASKDNWCMGNRHENGFYCAIGHLQKYEGVTEAESVSYFTPLVQECADQIFNGEVDNIWKTNDHSRHYCISPKTAILRACRKAIRKIDPSCQLGLEYET